MTGLLAKYRCRRHVRKPQARQFEGRKPRRSRQARRSLATGLRDTGGGGHQRYQPRARGSDFKIGCSCDRHGSYVPECTRVRCRPLDFGFCAGSGGLGFGKATTELRAAGASSHQPSLSSRRGSRDRRNFMKMIFAINRPCPADWQCVGPVCSGFVDFCADFVQVASRRIEDELRRLERFRVGSGAEPAAFAPVSPG